MSIQPVSGLTQANITTNVGSATAAPPVQVAAPAPQQTAPASAAQSPHSEPSQEQVKAALKSINETIQSMSPEVEFTLDEDSHRTVVKVIDKQTQQVIRQMPTEETLAISKALDKLQGLLIKQKA